MTANASEHHYNWLFLSLFYEKSISKALRPKDPVGLNLVIWLLTSRDFVFILSISLTCNDRSILSPLPVLSIVSLRIRRSWRRSWIMARCKVNNILVSTFFLKWMSAIDSLELPRGMQICTHVLRCRVWYVRPLTLSSWWVCPRFQLWPLSPGQTPVWLRTLSFASSPHCLVPIWLIVKYTGIEKPCVSVFVCMCECVIDSMSPCQSLVVLFSSAGKLLALSQVSCWSCPLTQWLIRVCLPVCMCVCVSKIFQEFLSYSHRSGIGRLSWAHIGPHTQTHWHMIHTQQAYLMFGCG